MIDKIRAKYFSLGMSRQTCTAINNDVVLKFRKKDFWRGHHKFDGEMLFENEKKYLRLLNAHNCFPSILFEDSNYFIMENKGRPIEDTDINDEVITQIWGIAKILCENNIYHRDIKKDNLLITNGYVALIDFEWACFEDNQFLCTRELFQDRESLTNNFKAFEQVLDDLSL